MMESSLPPVSTMPAIRNSVPLLSMMSDETRPFSVACVVCSPCVVCVLCVPCADDSAVSVDSSESDFADAEEDAEADASAAR